VTRHLEVDADGRPRLVDAEPAACPPGAVRVDVGYVGVCHSDIGTVASHRGEVIRLGHEVSGIVTESRSPAIAVGTRVAALVQDGYADEIVVPQHTVVALDDDCSLLDAALAEPLACVIGGLEQISWREVVDPVVIGCGFMGLLAVRYLAVLGLAVTVVEPRPNARQLALDLGATLALPPDESVAALAPRSVVIEATGVQAGVTSASGLVDVDGTLGLLGYHQSADGVRAVPMQAWNYRAIRVLNLHNRHADRTVEWMRRAQRCAARGSIRPSALVDRIAALDELPALLASGLPPTAVKAAIAGRAATPG